MSKLHGYQFPKKNLKRKFLKKGFIVKTKTKIPNRNIRAFLDEKKLPP